MRSLQMGIATGLLTGLGLTGLAACARAPLAADTHADAAMRVTKEEVTTKGDPGDAGGSIAPLSASATPDAAAPPRDTIDPDGNDDPEDVGTGRAPDAVRLDKVGTAPLALTRICDLRSFGGALYAAHANQPLGTDGATITRYVPGDAKAPFKIGFDWNRHGEPTKGGGAGQGFLRVHAIDGRLFVADADPPYGGLGLVDHGTEGYVFVSDAAGTFAPPRAPHYRPPAAPGPEKPGAGVLPRAYHVIDVIRFRGATYASTGSVPPKEAAWRGPSPGALHRANDDLSRWTYETDYPYPWKDGVWRLTFMVRFKDRLYAGIQDYDQRDPNDYVYFTPAKASTSLAHEDAHPTRVTRSGTAQTLRWWVDTHVHPHRLYWIATTRDGVTLRVTTDGDRWAEVSLPPDAGRPTDVRRFRDAVMVLTEKGLYRLQGEAVDAPKPLDLPAPWPVANAIALAVASVPFVPADLTQKKVKPATSPFVLNDYFCAAPLAVHENVLYAGGQRGGSLYRFVDAPRDAGAAGADAGTGAQ